jgi:hypothetical protein
MSVSLFIRTINSNILTLLNKKTFAFHGALGGFLSLEFRSGRGLTAESAERRREGVIPSRFMAPLAVFSPGIQIRKRFNRGERGEAPRE